MHRSHSTCTFHRTFPLAGHDDPFFLWPLFPGNSRTQSIGADRNQLSVFRVFTRTLATRHSLLQHIDDFFITGGKTVKVMKGHSSVVKKKEKKFFRRRRNSCCWTRKNRARLPRLVKQQLEPRNPFQRFLRVEAASKATTTTFHGQKFYDRAENRQRIYILLERGVCFRAFTVRRRTSNRL